MAVASPLTHPVLQLPHSAPARCCSAVAPSPRPQQISPPHLTAPCSHHVPKLPHRALHGLQPSTCPSPIEQPRARVPEHPHPPRRPTDVPTTSFSRAVRPPFPNTRLPRHTWPFMCPIATAPCTHHVAKQPHGALYGPLQRGARRPVCEAAVEEAVGQTRGHQARVHSNGRVGGGAAGGKGGKRGGGAFISGVGRRIDPWTPAPGALPRRCRGRSCSTGRRQVRGFG